jgi:hypothetical protein
MKVDFVLRSCVLQDSMEQSPSSEANSYSASQEIHCLLWNQNVGYCVYEPLLPLLPALSQVRVSIFHCLGFFKECFKV